MYMAGSTNRQDEANPAIYPATLRGKLCLSCQLGQKNSQEIQIPQWKSLRNKYCSSVQKFCQTGFIYMLKQ